MDDKTLEEINKTLKKIETQNEVIIDILKKSFDMALGGVDQFNGDFINDEVSGNIITG